MLKVQVKYNRYDLEKLKDLPKEFHAGLVKGVRRAVIYAEGKSKERFNTPGNLKVRTGHLRRSITSGVLKKANSISGWIGTNVVYGPIHEFGGTIYPKKGKYLKFPIEGRWKSVKKVVIPKRPYLTPAIEENIDRIGDIIIDDIIKEMD